MVANGGVEQGGVRSIQIHQADGEMDRARGCIILCTVRERVDNQAWMWMWMQPWMCLKTRKGGETGHRPGHRPGQRRRTGARDDPRTRVAEPSKDGGCCSAVLCCVVLCCAVLCYAMLCRTALARLDWTGLWETGSSRCRKTRLSESGDDDGTDESSLCRQTRGWRGSGSI